MSFTPGRRAKGSETKLADNAGAQKSGCGIPMPRADRRIQLLDIAREIINGQGIGALTMEALAEQSGASKPIVYKHFSNREAVVIALLDDHFEYSTNYVTSRVDHAKTIYEYIETAIDCLFEIQLEKGFDPRNITNGFSSVSSVNEAYLLNQKRAHEVFWGLVDQQIDREQVSEVAAYTLMIMVQDTVSQFAKRCNDVDRDTLKRMVSGALHSLIPEPGLKKPITPADVLEAAARDRELRTRKAG